MGRGELASHHPVGGVLVLVPLLQLWLDAELVERAAEERRLHAHAEHAETTARLQPDLIERGRQHVTGQSAGLLAERLGPGDGGLATLGEGPDADPQLLHDRPGQRSADLDEQPDDTPIPARLVQRPQRRAEQPASSRPQPGQRVMGVRVGGRFGQIEFEQDGWAVSGQRGHAIHGRRRARTPELRLSGCRFPTYTWETGAVPRNLPGYSARKLGKARRVRAAVPGGVPMRRAGRRLADRVHRRRGGTTTTAGVASRPVLTS